MLDYNLLGKQRASKPLPALAWDAMGLLKSVSDIGPPRSWAGRLNRSNI
jgi:hypothetical protein